MLYVLASVSLLAGLFSGRAQLFTVAYSIAAVALLAWIWTWLALRGIALRRQTRTRRAQVGHVFRETFRVRKTGWLPKLWLEIRDHSTLPRHRVNHIVPSLVSSREHSWDVGTICVARGEFQLGPLSLTAGDPFGFFRSLRRIGAVDRLLVYPMTVNLERVHLHAGLLSGGDAQRQLTHQITTNASSIRDYVPGDSLNRIHWRSTARTGDIMVKEFELDPLVDLWLICDFSRASLVEDSSVKRVERGGTIFTSPSRIPPSTEEYCAVATASLAKHFLDDRRVVGFAAYMPHRQVIQPGRGNRQLIRIYRSLALARSQARLSLRALLSLESQQFTRGTTAIIITASLDPAWVSEAQVLLRRGLRLLCVFIDPQTFQPNLDSSAQRGMLQLAKIPTLRLTKGEDIAVSLQQRPQ